MQSVTAMPLSEPTSARRAQAEGVSVVMVSYRTGPVLFESIEAVLAEDQQGVDEVILVNNGNPDAVVAVLTRMSAAESRLKIVSGHGNVGFARGCNIGASESESRYLLLLNPDCRLAPFAVPELLTEASKFGDDWLLGCRLTDAAGREQRATRRALLTPCTALAEALRLDRFASFRPLNLHREPLPDRTTRVPAISGALMMLPTSTYRSVGGMDEGYFLHVDDLDFCLRLHRAGIPIYFAPHVTAVHHGGTSGTNPVWVEWCKTRGFLRYFRTHFFGPWLLPVAVATLIRFGLKAASISMRRSRRTES